MRLLTAPGIAGVAVLHFGAAERVRLLSMLLTADGAELQSRPHSPPRLVRLRLHDTVIDDALLVDRGDDGIELHTHGSPAVVRGLTRAFADQATPAPMASPASTLLRDAISVPQLSLAAEQMQFDFERELAAMMRLPPGDARAAIEATMRRSRTALALAQPLRAVLVGRQNAGKSSLFNRLLFRERVLTGPLPGLTRDPVNEVTTLDGYPYELIDTAGEGEVSRDLDARAIERGRELRSRGLTVLVIAAPHVPDPAELQLARDGCFVVRNKTDLRPGSGADEVPAHVAVSATAQDAGTIRAAVGGELRRFRRLPPAGAVGGVAAVSAPQFQQLLALAAQLGLPAE